MIKYPNIVLAALAIGMVAYFGSVHSSSADPNDAGTQANPKLGSDASEAKAIVKPAAATLVGREVCRECHSGNYQLHSQHGHASTFRSVKGSSIVAKLAGKQFDAGEDYGTFHYSSDPNGDLFVTLPSRFDDSRFPLQYVLGSGQHAQTMLTLVTNPDGESVGIEHRVSCYRDDRISLTPAHSQKKPRSTFEFFGDSFQGEPLQRCIYCHTTRANVAGDAVQDLIANVNCEKCHGPGSEHVRLARLNEKPPPFSVGQASWDTESELQLCGDCHRMPRNVTEKEIRDYSKFLVRFQPIGLLRSRCYLDSNRELRCTTCHNPHQSIQELEAEDHVQDCLQCHQQEKTTHVACPVEPDSGCIECHMPAIEVDQGLRFHDHWIRIRED